MLDMPSHGANAGAHDDMDTLDPVLSRATAVLRKPVTLSLDFEDRVMTAVHREVHPLSGTGPLRRLSRARRWATTPRRVLVSPLGSFALAAGMAAILIGGVWLGRRTVAGGSSPQKGLASSAVLVADSQAPTQAVEFIVAVPGASRVTLVGDFNEWNPTATALHATERDGVWSVTVPLMSGRHEYAFVVDGKRWMPDPRAPRAASDDFGTPNSVVTVSERS
jgi:hypothetical protein